MLSPRAQVFVVDWRNYSRQCRSRKYSGVDWYLSETIAGAVLERKYSVWTGESILMLQQSKRLCDAQRTDAQKRLRGSVAKWGGVQADPLMMSRCSTWQNASLKEPSENAEYPWGTPIPKEELESESVPLPVVPIGLWRSAMITNYDLMLLEFTSDGTSLTILQPSKHDSVSRMFLREKPQSVRFMIIVTDPCNVSTREVIKVSREVTETTPLMCAAQAPLEMVLSKPLKPTPQRVNKPLIDKAAGKTNDDRAKVDEIDKNRCNEASSAKVDEVDMTNAEIVKSKEDKSDTVAEGAESQNDNVAKSERDEASEAKTDAVAEIKNSEVPQECDSKADVERATEAPQQGGEALWGISAGGWWPGQSRNRFRKVSKRPQLPSGTPYSPKQGVSVSLTSCKPCQMLIRKRLWCRLTGSGRTI